MGFGNPYGETYHPDQVLALAENLRSMGVGIVSLADTVGLATPGQIEELVGMCRSEFPTLQWGVHLHARPDGQVNKIAAAFRAGCRRFDGAIGGFGGCPFAEDELVGNVNTGTLIDYLGREDPGMEINFPAYQQSVQLAQTIFP